MSRHRTSDRYADDKDKAQKLWGPGLSTSAIAERLGRTRHTIGRWVSNAGLRNPGEAPRHRYDGVGSTHSAQGVGGRMTPRIAP
jgi:uncharacterized protein YjcR